MTKLFCVSLSMALALLARMPKIEGPAHAAEPAPPFQSASPADAETFAALMTESMVRMHAGMGVPDTHQPDRDFAAMMIPHHQGAVDMALAELRFGLLGANGTPATHVTLFDQGLVQILQAAVTGLPPRQPFFLALAGTGVPEPLASFTTNPAGAAVVNTVGPIRQVIRADGPAPARTLVLISGTPAHPGERVQHQAP